MASAQQPQDKGGPPPDAGSKFLGGYTPEYLANEVDLNLGFYYDIGPEVTFGYQGSDDTRFGPSLYASLRTTLHFGENKNWSLNSSVSVQDDDTEALLSNNNDDYGDVIFELDDLTAEYRTDRFGVFAGVFRPNFGTERRYQGIGKYGTDLILYDLTEKTGFGGDYTFGSGEGQPKHTVSASVFDDFRSFAVGLDGELPQVASSFRYHLAYAQEEEDRNDDRSDGFVASFGQTAFDLNDGKRLKWLAEYAYVSNYEDTDEAVSFWTLGAVLDWDKYVFSASYGYADGYNGADEQDDELGQLVALSVGYKIRDYGTLTLAYRYQEIEGADDNTIALTFSNYHHFTPLGQTRY